MLDNLCESDGVGDGIGALTLDAVDGRGTLLRREELGALGEVDNEEERDDAETDRDGTEDNEDPAKQAVISAERSEMSAGHTASLRGRASRRATRKPSR